MATAALLLCGGEEVDSLWGRGGTLRVIGGYYRGHPCHVPISHCLRISPRDDGHHAHRIIHTLALEMAICGADSTVGLYCGSWAVGTRVHIGDDKYIRRQC